MICYENKFTATLYWATSVPMFDVSEGTDRRNTLSARRNSHRPRIGSTHLDPRPMPAVIIHRQRLADGTRVAVARSNDVFVVAQFDDNDIMLQAPVRFDGGQAHDEAMAWVKKTANRAKSL
jgi:hypothetical protein